MFDLMSCLDAVSHRDHWRAVNNHVSTICVNCPPACRQKKHFRPTAKPELIDFFWGYTRPAQEYGAPKGT